MYSPKYVLYNMLFYKNINHLLINVKQPDYMNHISQQFSFVDDKSLENGNYKMPDGQDNQV